MSVSDWGSVPEWRNYSGITSTDIDDDQAQRFLTWAIQQVNKEATQLIRDELVTKDGTSNYFFTGRRYFADMEMASPDAEIGTDDVTVYEFDSEKGLLVDISAQVAAIDGLNCYFTLNSGYPTSNRSVYATYRIIGRPLTEIIGSGTETRYAVYQYMTVQALREIKRDRLKNGIITYTSGGETVTRDEKEFDNLVQVELDRYHQYISNIKPIYLRRMKTGYNHRRGIGLRNADPPYSHGGRLWYGGNFGR